MLWATRWTGEGRRKRRSAIPSGPVSADRKGRLLVSDQVQPSFPHDAMGYNPTYRRRVTEMIQVIGKELVSQGTAFTSLHRFCRIPGKRVLEVGGNSDCVAATPFALNGASKIVVTGLDDVDVSIRPPHPVISLESADALKLSEKYAASSFDLIYGISILEHIPNTAKFLSEVSHTLSKGGMAFLQGSPIWTGPLGHHIHLTPWQNNTIGCYQFIPSQSILDLGVQVFNPIPDWGQILYTKDQMAVILTDKNIPEGDKAEILHQIYESELLCRASVNSIIDAVHNSGLVLVEMEFDRVEIPDEVWKRLIELHGADEDYSIMGVRMILRKN
jgi:hypothetical protein